MKVTRNVSKPTIAIIGVVLLGIAVFLVGSTISEKKEYSEKLEDCSYTTAEVIECRKNKHKDSDGNTYYKYAIIAEYQVDSETYTIDSGEILDEEYDVGDEIDIIYENDNPKEAYIASEDGLLGEYLPYQVAGYGKLIGAAIVFMMSIVIFAFLFENSRVQVLMIGFAFTLSGGALIYFGIAIPMFGSMIIGAIMAGLGLLILFGNGFKSSKKRKELEQQEYRLFIVRDMLPDSDSNNYIAILGMITQNGEYYYSYNTYNMDKFAIGNKYQLDIAKLNKNTTIRTVGAYSNTVDISYLEESSFEELNGAMEMLAEMIEKTYGGINGQI